MYINPKLEMDLRVLSESDKLSTEEKKVMADLMKLVDEEVYCASYDKDAIIAPAITYAHNILGCTQSDDEIEEKIRHCPEFFDRVGEGLSDWENFPTDADMCETVEDTFVQFFEVDSYGKLLFKGFTDL